MKRLLIRAIGPIVLLHLLFVGSYSQVGPVESNQPYSAEFGDFRIGLAPVLLGNTPNGLQFGGRIYLSAYINRYLSFDTDLCLSRDYFHAGPGIIGIPVAMIFANSLQKPDEEDEGTELTREGIASFLFGVACVLLSVEHIAGHIPLSKDLEISPYISFLRYRTQYPHSGEIPGIRIPEQFCFSTGLSLEKSIGRFVLSPFIEYTIGYGDKVSGYIAGLDCSLRFSVARKLSFG